MVRMQLGVRRVALEDRLLDNLGAESADVLNLVLALEERFGISIDEESVGRLRTVRDVIDAVRERLAAGRRGEPEP